MDKQIPAQFSQAKEIFLFIHTSANSFFKASFALKEIHSTHFQEIDCTPPLLAIFRPLANWLRIF
jgi:hypothetical protein